MSDSEGYDADWDDDSSPKTNAVVANFKGQQVALMSCRVVLNPSDTQREQASDSGDDTDTDCRLDHIIQQLASVVIQSCWREKQDQKERRGQDMERKRQRLRRDAVRLGYIQI